MENLKAVVKDGVLKGTEDEKDGESISSTVSQSKVMSYL